MNYEDESFVKVYKRQTLGSKFLGWDGRAVLRALFLHVDRAGVLDLDDVGPAEAIAALEELPIEIATAGMEKLIARGTVVVTGSVLFIPNFMVAQEAKQSDAQRQRESRAARAAKARAAELGLPVTKRDEPQMPRGGPPLASSDVEPEDSPDERSGVTKRDESSPYRSHGVTERSRNPTAGHSRSDQTDQKNTTTQGPDRSKRPAPAAVVVTPVQVAPSAKIPCPADLELLTAQRAQLTMGKGMSDYQVDELSRRFRANFTANADDLRPLVAWRKCLAMWVSSEYTNANHRPPRSPDEETEAQQRRRLKEGPRQPNVLDHSTDEAHLRAIGGTQE